MNFRDITNAKPVGEREPSNDYKRVLNEILEQGNQGISQQEVDSLAKIAPSPMHFKFSEGFPLITERNMAPDISGKPTVWQQAVGEIFAFINGVRTKEGLADFGCHWWDPWVTEAKCSKRGLETGDIGPGSYGAAFHDFPTADGGSYDQFQNIIEQIRELPHLRTHFITPWIPQYTIRGEGKKQKVTVCPCHGWVHIRVIDGKLTLHMMQRSGDLPIGVPSNIVQYAALTLAIAHVTGLEPYEYVHSISDAHIYIDQVETVKKMLERDSKPFPTMKINTEKKDLFDFRYEDFQLSDYEPHPGIKGIPVAI
ncbi:MAG: thymidylate synthase [Candidatus Paceibacterota bacterium]